MAGSFAGDTLGYAIASWTGREPAELKDMLIWSAVMGWPVGALAGLWLALMALQYSAEARRIAFMAVGFAVVIDAALMLASFDWPKRAGRPSVAYELRLPPGLPPQRADKIDLVLWADNTGHGCYVAKARQVDDRTEIAGSFTVYGSDTDRFLLLRLNRETEGYWRMPIQPNAALDKEYGPWQRIEFVPNPRTKLPPLPRGEYEIRYRVRKYL
jgi:hypothetical protein